MYAPELGEAARELIESVGPMDIDELRERLHENGIAFAEVRGERYELETEVVRDAVEADDGIYVGDDGRYHVGVEW